MRWIKIGSQWSAVWLLNQRHSDRSLTLSNQFISCRPGSYLSHGWLTRVLNLLGSLVLPVPLNDGVYLPLVCAAVGLSRDLCSPQVVLDGRGDRGACQHGSSSWYSWSWSLTLGPEHLLGLEYISEILLEINKSCGCATSRDQQEVIIIKVAHELLNLPVLALPPAPKSPSPPVI